VGLARIFESQGNRGAALENYKRAETIFQKLGLTKTKEGIQCASRIKSLITSEV
jgi:hypothetical protein